MFMRNSAITISANYTQHPRYTAQYGRTRVYAYTYRKKGKNEQQTRVPHSHRETDTRMHTQIHTYKHTHIHVPRLLPPSFARVLKSQFSDSITR